MRKSFIVFLIIGGIALGLGMFNSLINSGDVNSANPQASPANSAQTLGTEIKPDPVTEPVSFSIPSLGVVNAPVESVGLDKESKMDIPKKDEDVAWYNLGAKPGERGNVVMAGHLDTKTGAPAVFYQINKLKPGDELLVKAKDGKEYKYAVTEVRSYELDKFPLVEVFGAGDKARLNLITCEGTYNKNSKLYSHRLVVYSELKM
jgi:LPXTG-site transpeptidase (sortase) family protein